MKLSVKLIIFTLCLCLVSACGNEANTTNTPSHNTTSNETTGQTNNTQQEAPKTTEETTSQLSEEQQEIVSALEAALAFTNKQNMVYFSYYNHISNYYKDGTESMTYTNDYGDMQRDPALVSLNGTMGYTEYQKNGENYDVVDEHSTGYTYYYSKDLGQFYNFEGDDSWHQSVLPDDFKTVGHIEDLISFFLQFPDQLSVTTESYESGFDGSDETEILEYRRINLDFSLNQFTENTVFLTKNFFSGNHFPDAELDSPYTIVSPELTNYSVSIILDEQNRVNEFYVFYETEDFDKTMYTHFNTMSVSFFYDQEFLPIEIVIPDEVITNAIVDGGRG